MYIRIKYVYRDQQNITELTKVCWNFVIILRSVRNKKVGDMSDIIIDNLEMFIVLRIVNTSI